MEQNISVANQALKFRKEQYDILHDGRPEENGCNHCVAVKKTLGDVTTLNLTQMNAGVYAGGKAVLNVIPTEAQASFDIRISPLVHPSEIANQIDNWCREAQATATNLPPHSGVSWDFVKGSNCKRTDEHAVTPASGPWWTAFTDVLQSVYKTTVVPQIFPAATDSRFLRAIGVRAFGFSPMRNSPILLHEHNEYLDLSVFLEGCEVYVNLLYRLSALTFEEIEAKESAPPPPPPASRPSDRV